MTVAGRTSPSGGGWLDGVGDGAIVPPELLLRVSSRSQILEHLQLRVPEPSLIFAADNDMVDVLGREEAGVSGRRWPHFAVLAFGEELVREYGTGFHEFHHTVFVVVLDGHPVVGGGIHRVLGKVAIEAVVRRLPEAGGRQVEQRPGRGERQRLAATAT